MKTGIFTALLVCLMLSLSFGEQAPDFTLTDVKGDVYKLSELTAQKKYVLLDLYATW